MNARIPLYLSLFSILGCTSTGTIQVTTYGEDFIEQEIPAEADADGWNVKFDRFLVTIGQLNFAHGTDTLTVNGTRVWDVHKPGPHALATIEDAPAIHFDEAGFSIKAPDDNTGLGNGTQADLDTLKAGKFSVFVSGTATKGESTKTFAWGFTTATKYVECENESGAGIVVTPGGTTDVELTIHGDHLFMDDLVKDDATIHFGPFAAADTGASADGVITLEELAAIDLTSLPADRYGTGSVPNVRNLKDFVSAQVRTLGHWRGEGECRVTSP